jgi:predicted protein tyrosine phosphatase
MKKVADGIWVGNDLDVPLAKSKHYAILTVAKHGPHGHAAMLGYGTGAAPAGPNKLWVLQGNHFAVNVVDTEYAHPDGMKALDEAVKFVLRMRDAHKPVLIQCNQGHSRGPAVALASLIELGELPRDLGEARSQFLDLYPRYQPKGGVNEWLERTYG